MLTIDPSGDRFERRTVSDIKPDGDGDFTIYVNGLTWLTWHPGDTDRVPDVGDVLLIRPPRIISYEPHLPAKAIK